MSNEQLVEELQRLTGYTQATDRGEHNPSAIACLRKLALSYLANPDSISWDEIMHFEQLRKRVQVEESHTSLPEVSYLYQSVAYL